MDISFWIECQVKLSTLDEKKHNFVKYKTTYTVSFKLDWQILTTKKWKPLNDFLFGYYIQQLPVVLRINQFPLELLSS